MDPDKLLSIGISQELLDAVGWGYPEADKATAGNQVVKLMLDTNVFDALLQEDAMLDAIRWATRRRALEILVTHVQVDELLETAQRDLERAKVLMHTLLRAGAREVATHGAVLGRSRLGLSSFTSDETSNEIERFTTGKSEHLNDALIAATAREVGAALVTEDRRVGRYAAAFPGLQVQRLDDLRELCLEILKMRAGS